MTRHLQMVVLLFGSVGVMACGAPEPPPMPDDTTSPAPADTGAGTILRVDQRLDAIDLPPRVEPVVMRELDSFLSAQQLDVLPPGTLRSSGMSPDDARWAGSTEPEPVSVPRLDDPTAPRALTTCS